MLTDTLYRQPRTFGVQLLQKRGDGGARELSTRRLRLDAGTTGTFQLADEETVVVLQQGRGTFAADGQSWPVSRSGVFTERATALYLPPGVELTAKAETVLEAVLFSTPAPEGGKAALIGPADVARQRPRPRQLLARGARHLRHRSARAAPDGRRDVQPAGQLEQLSAAQARRQGRRADARRGLLLPIDPPQGFGQQILYTNDGESAITLGARRRRGAAAVRLSPGVGAAGLSRSAISGAWLANSASWRCTRIPRTSGFTTRRSRRDFMSTLRKDATAAIERAGIVAVIRIKDPAKLQRRRRRHRRGRHPRARSDDDGAGRGRAHRRPGAEDASGLPARRRHGARCRDRASRSSTPARRFIVSPVFRREVIDACHSRDVAVTPGCFTPTEILDAWDAGADIVKVFPATALGPRLHQGCARAAAAGQADADRRRHARQRRRLDRAGAVAVGVGSALTDAKAIDGRQLRRPRAPTPSASSRSVRAARER